MAELPLGARRLGGGPLPGVSDQVDGPDPRAPQAVGARRGESVALRIRIGEPPHPLVTPRVAQALRATRRGLPLVLGRQPAAGLAPRAVRHRFDPEDAGRWPALGRPARPGWHPQRRVQIPPVGSHGDLGRVDVKGTEPHRARFAPGGAAYGIPPGGHERHLGRRVRAPRNTADPQRGGDNARRAERRHGELSPGGPPPPGRRLRQQIDEGARRRRAVGRNLGETARDGVLDVRRHLRPHGARGPRPLREHPRDDRLDARPREWRLADQHLVQHRGQRVHVAPRVEALRPARLLRAHVLGRARGEPSAGQRGLAALHLLHQLRDPEIGHHRVCAGE